VNTRGQNGPSRGLPPWLRDRFTLTLLVANLVTICAAMVEHWRILDVMLVYWGQSVMIGFFNVIRILELKALSPAGGRGPTREATTLGMRLFTVFMALFFACHYGGFHAVYLAFLVGFMSESKAGPSRVDLVPTLVCLAVFLAQQWSLFRHRLECEPKERSSFARIFFFPYARILPMHLTILLGASFLAMGRNAGHDGRVKSACLLLFFLGLKTVADSIMHLMEHRGRRQPRAAGHPPPAKPAPSS
jgi:hypothetical protein